MITVDGGIFVAAKETNDLLTDFLEMLAEKEHEVSDLIQRTRKALTEGLDYDQVESLNERASEIFDLDETLEETYRSLDL